MKIAWMPLSFTLALSAQANTPYRADRIHLQCLNSTLSFHEISEKGEITDEPFHKEVYESFDGDLPKECQARKKMIAQKLFELAQSQITFHVDKGTSIFDKNDYFTPVLSGELINFEERSRAQEIKIKELEASIVQLKANACAPKPEAIPEALLDSPISTDAHVNTEAAAEAPVETPKKEQE